MQRKGEDDALKRRQERHGDPEGLERWLVVRDKEETRLEGELKQGEKERLILVGKLP